MEVHLEERLFEWMMVYRIHKVCTGKYQSGSNTSFIIVIPKVWKSMNLYRLYRWWVVYTGSYIRSQERD